MFLIKKKSGYVKAKTLEVRQKATIVSYFNNKKKSTKKIVLHTYCSAKKNLSQTLVFGLGFLC